MKYRLVFMAIFRLILAASRGVGSQKVKFNRLYGEGVMTRALDGHRHLTLVSGTVAGHAAGRIFALSDMSGEAVTSL